MHAIDELRFGKVDLAIHEDGPHLKPSEVAADLPRVAQQLRAFNASFAAFHVGLGPLAEPEARERLRVLCRLARVLTVPLLCVPAAPAGGDFDAEVERLTTWVRLAEAEGVILSVETHSETLTADPAGAAELCKRVPGLGLTLDPSHYLIGPHRPESYDELFKYVRHVRLRDTGPEPGEFQVRVGQGDVEYGRIVAQLERHRYDRALTVDIRDIPDPGFPMEPEVRKLKFLLESLV